MLLQRFHTQGRGATHFEVDRTESSASLSKFVRASGIPFLKPSSNATEYLKSQAVQVKLELRGEKVEIRAVPCGRTLGGAAWEIILGAQRVVRAQLERDPGNAIKYVYTGAERRRYGVCVVADSRTSCFYWSQHFCDA